MSYFFHTLLFSLPFIWIGCLLRLMSPGPKSTFRVCLGIALVGGLLGGIMGKALGLGEYGGFFPPFIGICAVCTFNRIRKAWLHHLASTAIDVREFASRLFASLDVDGDGVITRVDIEDFRDAYMELAAMAQSKDAEVFLVLDKNLSVIGHVVRSQIAVMPAPMGGAHSIDTYGISREDLHTWPTRAFAMLSDEFGL